MTGAQLIVLTTLCVTCGFVPAWAATCVAAKAACVHGLIACAWKRHVNSFI